MGGLVFGVPMVQATPSAPAIRVAGVGKRFGATVALACVSAALLSVVAGGASAMMSPARVRTRPGAASKGVLAQFSGISCPTATECFAAGAYAPRVSSQRYRPLIERFDGKAWSVSSAPVPRATWSRLYGIACAGARSCFAVGSKNVGSVFAPVTLTERWDGSKWSTVPSLAPSRSIDSELNAVSCPTRRFCMAVGDKDFNRTGVTSNIAELWNGTRWTVVPSAAPAKSSTLLTSVSCRTPSNCTAAGWWGPQTGNAEYPLTTHWNGKRWRVTPNPHPPKLNDSLMFGISCPAGNGCIATGEFFTHTNQGFKSSNLAERSHRARWSVLATPDPGSRDQLSAVSCSGRHACMSVGNYVGRAAEVTLAELWNGRRWVVLSTPSPPRSASGLTGISCVKPALCVASGAYGTARGILTLTEVWRHRRWRIVPSPSP